MSSKPGEFLCEVIIYEKQGTRWTLVIWWMHLQLFSRCFLHAVVQTCGAQRPALRRFPFQSFLSASGSDGKLRVAVHGDARQVVPDDLVHCREKRSVSIRLLNILTSYSTVMKT